MKDLLNFFDKPKDPLSFKAVKISLASPEKIRSWSYGEVKKPETINYRTFKPERDGLFCAKIFGPVKDYECNCGKYKRMKHRGVVCEKCGVEVIQSKVRRERLGHIELATPVAHIWFLRSLPSRIGAVLDITLKNLERVLYCEAYVVMDPGKTPLKKFEVLNEDEHNQAKKLYKSDFKSGIGSDAVRELLREVDGPSLAKELRAQLAKTSSETAQKALAKRLKVVEAFNQSNNKFDWMMLEVIPVIPPDLRPLVPLDGGRFATSDLNDLYRRVINRNNRLKRLQELNAPEIIIRNEKRMLQEAVDALFDNGRRGRTFTGPNKRPLRSLSDMLKGKQGRFRQNLLGKRVDYSGRSVIVVGPELKLHQCGLPKKMALELFKPFIFNKLEQRGFVTTIKSAKKMVEKEKEEVWDILEEVVKEHPVLLNRAPTLHRLGIQAFEPVLIEGKAIQLHPLVCATFNADFDGDQMAVHVPLSDAAQDEAREIMASNKNLLKPADGSPILHIEQDIVLGCYYLTYERKGVTGKTINFTRLSEALMAFDAGKVALQSRVKLPFRGEQRETTLGRILFNEIFPEDFPFQDETMTKKKLANVMALAYTNYGQDKTAFIADDLKDIGFLYATKSGLSLGMGDFTEIPALKSILENAENRVTEISEQYEQGFITNEERYRLTVETWMNADSEVLAKLSEQFNEEDTAMAIAAISGARGNIGQVKNTVGMLGVTTDATGRAIELPIRSNYKQGFSPLEYFTATRGARKGMIDTALKTADSGYLTRRLVDVSQDVFTLDDEESQDKGFGIFRSDAEEIGVSYASRLEGRFAADTIKGHVKKGEAITSEIAQAIESDAAVDGVRIMSVLSCPNVRGITRKSYGIDPATGELVADFYPIGVIAAQSIGEPGTQLTLRTFHSGGVAGEDITTGLPRVEELFEVRTPKGQAFLADISGQAKAWEEGDHYVVEITAKDDEPVEFPLNGRKVHIKDNANISIGDVMASEDEGANPLTAPIAGKAKVTKKSILVTPSKQSAVRYEIPGFKQLVVKDGDEVVAGQRLTNGSINLHELMRLQGVEATQRYIMNEILRIFASQGQNIADKHLEVIVRQMFSRVQIEDAGDSEFVTGDIVSKIAVLEENDRLEKENKEPVLFNQLLLGITKASLSTESFLSAASFQDTTRVLIAAATSGKVDNLYGLKENVILGRMIPVGTGYNAYSNQPENDEVAVTA